ncbi:MAG: hypothetical protein V4594_04820 [Bacteroidota bacterium]
MRYRTLIVSSLPAAAMALYPFMIFKDRELLSNRRIVRHELIHFRQQLELLILPFYVLYLFNYLFNLLIYKNHDQAYRNIRFEREAYTNDHDESYLKRRKCWAWLR